MFLGSLIIFGLGGSTAGSVGADIHHVTFVEKMTVQLINNNKIDTTIRDYETLNLSLNDNRMEVVLSDENIINAEIRGSDSLSVAVSEG